ncbi:MAG: sulfatase-like hydrolase/transferase [Verrucomicrobiales bacterium]|nr:sulfatase-like hydrolase/transferase [Verrucomicrobiales bacterium]
MPRFSHLARALSLVVGCPFLTLGILKAEPPNILFILADDLGYGDLGCYGADDLKTPHLDQLAKDGVRFTSYYANGSTCSPTRAAFVTGRYQQRLGLDNALTYQEMGRGLPPNGQTIATDLRAKGCATGLTGKWHLGYDFERKPLQQGFDHFFGLLGGNHHYFQHMDRIGVPDLWSGNEEVRRDEYSTDLMTEDSIAFLRDHRDRPFLLYLAHPAPHFPWQGPMDRDKVIEPKKKSWQEGDRETYIAMVEHLDAGIGQTLAELDRLGLREKTLVVFSSDNGGHTYSRNAPLHGEKGTLWEGGIRVPCIARWPGVLKAGSEFAEPCITLDWTATFRRLAGWPADPAIEDGVDLMPALTGKEKLAERSLFWRRQSGPRRKVEIEEQAVRHGPWKWLRRDGEAMLFDLETDLSETNNVIAAHPEIARQLTQAWEAWDAEMDASPKLP